MHLPSGCLGASLPFIHSPQSSKHLRYVPRGSLLSPPEYSVHIQPFSGYMISIYTDLAMYKVCIQTSALT